MKKTIGKRVLAACLMFVIAFMLPATPLYKSESRAASANRTYIAEAKLFIKRDATVATAKAWCESQGDGWQVLDGDLNGGATAIYKRDIGVFLCYRTTTDPTEAITDLAVMNEKGSYSEGAYEMLLKEQKEQYNDIVKNMKGMLAEYRRNYNKKTPMAVRAHDFLNIYKEDDSGELLGDLLLTVEDDKLVDILLQINGIVLLTIEQQLAAACDTGKTTWLDRMQRLGSYDGLKAAFSRNMSGGNVAGTLDAQYREKATILLDKWDDIHGRIDKISGFLSGYDLENANEEKYKEWLKDMSLDGKEFVSFQEAFTLIGLAGYRYGDGTLLDFFSKSRDQIEKEGVETLYPMAASITEGQLCALKDSIGLFNLLQDALAATVSNKSNAGMASTLKESVSEKAINDAEKFSDRISESVKDLAKGEKISVYEGVDREVYQGGVAVTTNAENYSKGSENHWTGAFFKDGKFGNLSIYLGIGFASTAVLAVGASILECAFMKTVKNEVLVHDRMPQQVQKMIDTGDNFVIKGDMIYYDPEYFNASKKVKNLGDFLGKGEKAVEEGKEAVDGLVKAEAPLENTTKVATTTSKVFRALKIGFTIFTVLLGVADIVLTAYAMYKYYNAEHMPIPHHMVDLSYSERAEASYIAYRSVRDQDGKCGDLNAGECKQWLALYYTKDGHAGTPILAPGSNSTMVVKTGDSKSPDSNCSPLHMFGTPNAVQNLTYSDGGKGWSFNDRNNGTYLFFTHSDMESEATVSETAAPVSETAAPVSETAAPVSESAATVDEPTTTDGAEGTVISSGFIALVGAVGLVACVFIGGVCVRSSRRKKQKIEKE